LGGIFLVCSWGKFGYIGREAISANAPILLKLLQAAAGGGQPRSGLLKE
jgi:hypothetical protein